MLNGTWALEHFLTIWRIPHNSLCNEESWCTAVQRIWHCAACQRPNSDRYDYCPCGTLRSCFVLCTRCGYGQDERLSHCRSCGAVMADYDIARAWSAKSSSSSSSSRAAPDSRGGHGRITGSHDTSFSPAEEYASGDGNVKAASLATHATVVLRKKWHCSGCGGLNPGRLLIHCMRCGKPTGPLMQAAVEMQAKRARTTVRQHDNHRAGSTAATTTTTTTRRRKESHQEHITQGQCGSHEEVCLPHPSHDARGCCSNTHSRRATGAHSHRSHSSEDDEDKAGGYATDRDECVVAVTKEESSPSTADDGGGNSSSCCSCTRADAYTRVVGFCRRCRRHCEPYAARHVRTRWWCAGCARHYSVLERRCPTCLHVECVPAAVNESGRRSRRRRNEQEEAKERWCDAGHDDEGRRSCTPVARCTTHAAPVWDGGEANAEEEEEDAPTGLPSDEALQRELQELNRRAAALRHTVLKNSTTSSSSSSSSGSSSGHTTSGQEADAGEAAPDSLMRTCARDVPTVSRARSRERQTPMVPDAQRSWLCDVCGVENGSPSYLDEGAAAGMGGGESRLMSRYLCLSCLTLRPSVQDALPTECWLCPSCDRANMMSESVCIHCRCKVPDDKDDDDCVGAAKSKAAPTLRRIPFLPARCPDCACIFIDPTCPRCRTAAQQQRQVQGELGTAGAAMFQSAQCSRRAKHSTSCHTNGSRERAHSSRADMVEKKPPPFPLSSSPDRDAAGRTTGRDDRCPGQGTTTAPASTPQKGHRCDKESGDDRLLDVPVDAVARVP